MLNSITLKELVRRLRLLGFVGPYSGGRHLFMVRGTFKLRIPNPHKGEISRGLLAEILRQGGISRDKWNSI
ncbi:MAG: type II toxin-antitoxin system HicA family toxin [bacterium]|nr:type II toxin-antitoxin system HicA family toxin [bacterium]